MAALSDWLSLVRPDTPGAPDIVISDAVLRASIDFCKRSEIYTGDVTVGALANTRTAEVILPAGYSLARLIRLRGADGRKINPIDREKALIQPVYEIADKPRGFWLEGIKTVHFDRLPIDNETLTGTAALKPTRTATTVPDVLFEDWADSIASGAKYLLMQVPGKDWTNPELGAFHAGVFEQAIGNARVAVRIGKGDPNLTVRPVVFR